MLMQWISLQHICSTSRRHRHRPPPQLPVQQKLSKRQHPFHLLRPRITAKPSHFKVGPSLSTFLLPCYKSFPASHARLQPVLRISCRIYHVLLRAKDPELYAHLQKCNVEPQM